MQYLVRGPFKINKKQNGRLDLEKGPKKTFWDNVSSNDSRIRKACGCYLFAIKASKGYKPWYVGSAHKQNFERECFAAHKINIYNEAIAKRKGTAIIFFISKMTHGGKFSKISKNHQPDIEFIETLLIGACIKKNASLLNVQKTKHLREISIPGFINCPKGNPGNGGKHLRNTIY